MYELVLRCNFEKNLLQVQPFHIYLNIFKIIGKI